VRDCNNKVQLNEVDEGVWMNLETKMKSDVDRLTLLGGNLVLYAYYSRSSLPGKSWRGIRLLGQKQD
jgi:hypothetical protein